MTVSNRLCLASSVGCQVLCAISEKQISKSQVWMNTVALLQFCCILPYFEPKVNMKAVGCCKSQYWGGLTWPLNVTAVTVLSYFISSSQGLSLTKQEKSTLLCSFVLFQLFSDILRSTNPETGLLKLKTQQV